ncbi:MAG TPA: amidohydrolase family protein [Trebonia sp.]|jgi:L-fuconolactonase|nr:amidohydrolase family protein [Trebonia sp.]
MHDSGDSVAVEPDLPIIDPHHHLWTDGPGGRFMLDDLLADIGSGHDVRATVYIECESFYRGSGPAEFRSVGEVEFANGIAAMGASGAFGPARFCASIVGFADLRRGAKAATVIEGLVAAGNGRLHGIRQIASHDPEVRIQAPAGMLGDSGFREGYARLADYGLSFDAWMYHSQLRELLSLAAGHPDVPVIVNHAGGLAGMGAYATRRAEAFQDWRAAMGELARLPHVSVKLGGFFMPAFGLGFERAKRIDYRELAAAARPIIETCVELFGTKRCMFESNFPVTRDFLTYRDIWNTYKHAIRDYTVAEKADLLHDTAERVYRIPHEQP